jgi:nitrate/nitrite transporter NarK
VPFVIGVVATLVWGRLSDQTGNRKGMAAIALLLTTAGIGAAALLDDPYLKMAAFCVAAWGIFGTLAVFWTLPTSFLSGIAAAGGIAVINSIGNLAGFAGPYAMGAIKDATNSYQGGLFLLAGLAFIAMLIVLALRHDRHLEAAPVLAAVPAE